MARYDKHYDAWLEKELGDMPRRIRGTFLFLEDPLYRVKMYVTGSSRAVAVRACKKGHDD